MSNGASMDYNFGNKRQFQRTMWNQVARRIRVPAPIANVLYLAGEEDADRKVALRHGFQSLNMIAVEREKNVCLKLREKGTLTINANLQDVLEGWSSPRIHVVYADFCCGLTEDVKSFVMRLPSLAMFSESVIAINLMRGRDSASNDDRSEINTWRMSCGYEPTKHRGELAHILNFVGFLSLKEQVTGVYPSEEDQVFFHRWHSKMFGDGFFYSYKSKSGQVFDSAVFGNWSYRHFLATSLQFKFGSLDAFRDETDKLSLPNSVSVSPSKITRQIAAIKATRTRMIQTG